ncbi:MAG: futalosine hydrolase [Chitinophagaceae bacterium]|nr:futalosine hydrolase [Chitinophagaceae bacterium]
MQILLIAATALEIEPFTTTNSRVDTLITGVGVPAAIYHLQKRIHQIDYDFIIQAGIAGSFSNEITLGQVVMVQQDCFADLGMEEKGNYTPIFNTAFADKDEFPFTDGWLINTDENLKYIDLPKAKAITLNKVSDSELQKQQFVQSFNADIETMEGAALHYVCLQEHIPFLQIRSISNHVGERDKTKWKIKEAIENLNKELQILINDLTN